MDNKLTNFKNYELRFCRSTAPYRVFATWNIHYACNYKCIYCHAPKPEYKDARKAVYITTDEWIKIWERLYGRYGTWEILISGGEPFTYPGFMDLLIELSKIHIVGICTNLEWDVTYFVKHIGPERVRIETSFHPEFADLDKFMEKLTLLKDYGFAPPVNFVPWPPLLGMMEKIKKTVEAVGCQLTLQPFIGKFENRFYPQGYTEEEREYFKIFNDDCNLKTLNFKATKESDSTKGKLCRMGQNYVFIHPDGDASRCCRDHSLLLGNIINDSVSLLEEPVACNAENCNCWRCMLVGKENFWERNWGRPEINNLILEGRNSQAKVDNLFKILLVQPPVWGIYEPPVALAQLSSCLRKASYEVSIFDLNIEFYHKRKEEYNTVWAIEQSTFWANDENIGKFFNDNSDIIKEYVNRIVDTKPNLVGFSVNVCSLPATMELAVRIKQKIPQARLVIGGPMFSVPANVSGILEYDCMDVIIYGEGEETFCELPKFFIENRDLSNCRGIYFKKDGKIIKTKERPLIKDLDELPFLDLEKFPLDRYDPPGHLDKHISLMASRGCIQNCVFCGPKAYWQGYRSMSSKRIYEEIRYHIQNNPDIKHIEFLDLLFNGNMKNLDEFCDLMISKPIKADLKWHANVIIRPEMTSELLVKMKKAGCSHLTYGIESGSQRVLDLMRKRYKVEDADRVLKYTNEAGIEVTCNFMFGFPGEEEEDFQQTLDFLRCNAKYITTAYPSRSYCTIEPHSYLEKHMEEFNMISNPVNNTYWESKDGRNTYPERMKRCENFSSIASSLGVSVGLGLQTSVELDRWYNLGFYYDSKQDYKNAFDCFSKYLERDSKNEVIINKLEEIKAKISDNATEIKDASKIQSNNQICFNWDIHWLCNYRCPYCWFYGKWIDLRTRNRILTVRELIKAWNNIYRSYGSVKISITGGEPFLYPDFVELIKELSQMHKVEIITNLSVDIQPFIKGVNSKNVKVNPSFHPLFADFDKFIERALILKEGGLLNCVSYLAWPPQILRIGYYTQKFRRHSISISIQSFFGEYKGLRYPDAYTKEDKQIILPQIGERGGEPFQTEPFKSKGKLCAAGQRYGVIHPDGKVLRCGGINSCEGASIIGNLFEQGFRLLEKPSPCTFDICPCNEWAFLLEEKKNECAK